MIYKIINLNPCLSRDLVISDAEFPTHNIYNFISEFILVVG